ncbi:LPXTG cell wall anchor domain-containing protein [Salmonella enterica]
MSPYEEGGELPDTATALPLGILAGLGVMALGAFGMRKRK